MHRFVSCFVTAAAALALMVGGHSARADATSWRQPPVAAKTQAAAEPPAGDAPAAEPSPPDDLASLKERLSQLESELAALREASPGGFDGEMYEACDGCPECCDECCDPCCPPPRTLCCWHEISGGIVYFDVLYWKPEREFVVTGLTAVQPQTQLTIGVLEYEWDWGFRGGTGYRCSSGWDWVAEYTYFRSRGDFVSSPPTGLVVNEVGEQNLDYDVIDIVAGHWLCLNASADVRLFGGFRWAMLDQLAVVTQLSPTIGPPLGQTIARVDLNAYGLVVGGEAHWRFCPGLAGFFRGSGAVLVGDFDTLLNITGPGADPDVLIEAQFQEGLTVLGCSAGVHWRCGRLEASAGYELAAWNKVTPRTATLGDLVSDDLLLHGLFVRAGINY
jgi:hypothetical protein